MVVRSLNVKKDPFRLSDLEEMLFGLETSYLSAICFIMYLVNNTRQDITFPVNLLARYSSTQTRKHWKGIKDILHYLRGTLDMGLFYPRVIYGLLMLDAFLILIEADLKLDIYSLIIV